MISSKRGYSITINQIVCLGLCGLFLKGTIVDFTTVFGKAFLGNGIVFLSSLEETICIALMGLGIIAILFKKPRFVVIPFGVAAIIWYIAYFIYPETRFYVVNSYFSYFTSYLPYVCFFSFLVGDIDESCRQKNIRFILMIGIIRQSVALLSQTIMFIFPYASIYNGYMDMANCLLIGGIISMAYLSNKSSVHKKYVFVLVVLSIIYVLMSGSRGVLICYLTYIILQTLLLSKNENKGNRILYLVCLLIVLIFSKQIASTLITIGIRSRTLDVIASGNMFNDTAREDIYELMIESIAEKPSGYGLYGDRFLLNFDSEYLQSKYHYAFFAHNIIIELLVDFGVIGGTVATIALGYFLFKSFKSSEDFVKQIIIVFVSAGLTKLMWSGSYLTDQSIWILIGVLYGSLYVIKEKRKQLCDRR